MALTALFVAGCATSRVDWNSRIGGYTYDDAVEELGPPDKTTQLSDGSTVAEWLTRRGYIYTSAPYQGFYYPYGYGPFFYHRFDAYAVPSSYLRLAFDAEHRLKTWKRFAR